VDRAETIGRQPVLGLICNAAQYFPSDPSSAREQGTANCSKTRAYAQMNHTIRAC